ncbi:hypothetical protein M433DRAFT_464711 [Acidomyces richmondensis BFW]|nr:MAG: hypothetical protein FE78DRAFT_262779 [Acidomyces sp. 'richmondensis']KYG47897.1 hypothetical protein M433DRAFT_464711 [Acidomyces richmondensis BFW]
MLNSALATCFAACTHPNRVAVSGIQHPQHVPASGRALLRSHVLLDRQYQAGDIFERRSMCHEFCLLLSVRHRRGNEYSSGVFPRNNTTGRGTTSGHCLACGPVYKNTKHRYRHWHGALGTSGRKFSASPDACISITSCEAPYETCSYRDGK